MACCGSCGWVSCAQSCCAQGACREACVAPPACIGSCGEEVRRMYRGCHKGAQEHIKNGGRGGVEWRGVGMERVEGGGDEPWRCCGSHQFNCGAYMRRLKSQIRGRSWPTQGTSMCHQRHLAGGDDGAGLTHITSGGGSGPTPGALPSTAGALPSTAPARVLNSHLVQHILHAAGLHMRQGHHQACRWACSTPLTGILSPSCDCCPALRGSRCITQCTGHTVCREFVHSASLHHQPLHPVPLCPCIPASAIAPSPNQPLLRCSNITSLHHSPLLHCHSPMLGRTLPYPWA